MPVRSLSSSVFRWPDARAVKEALRRWAARVAQTRPEVLRIGYFGSYARGDWGVGSDLDVVIIVTQADKPFDMRAGDWDTRDLPIPTDLLVYTREEWDKLQERPMSPRFVKEIVWLDHKGASTAGNGAG